MSPAAEVVPPFEAIRLGRDYVAEHPGTEFLVGSGDSMLPLYRDHTVVVTRQVAVADLRAEMTAVYLSNSGRPIAHVLVRLTPDGWIVQGVGNARRDDTLVTRENLMGVVVRAFEPTTNPMLALLSEASPKPAVATIP